MTKRSCPSLFTLRIGFIPILIERHLCNFDGKPMPQVILIEDLCQKAGTQDSIFSIRFFCTIMLKPKTIYKSVALKGVVYN